MDKFSKFLEEKLMPIGQKINNIRFLQVIRMAMMPLIPFIIAGSFTLIVLNFPFIDKVLPAGFLEMVGNVFITIIRDNFKFSGNVFSIFNGV